MEDKLFISKNKWQSVNKDQEFTHFSEIKVIIDGCQAIEGTNIVFENYTVNNPYPKNKVGICSEITNDKNEIELIRFARFYDHYQYSKGLYQLLKKKDFFKYIKIVNTFKNRNDNRIDLKVNIYLNKKFILEMYDLNSIPELIYLIIIDKSLSISQILDNNQSNTVSEIITSNVHLPIVLDLFNKEFTRKPFDYQLQNMKWIQMMENQILSNSSELDFKIYDLNTVGYLREYLVKSINDKIYLDPVKKCMINLEELESNIITCKGGILADSVGLGKSFSIIGTIAQNQNKNNPDLLIAPRRLIHQWVDEIHLNYSSLKYLSIQNITSFRKLVKNIRNNPQYLCSFDVVLLPYSFICNKNYQEYLNANANNENNFNLHNYSWNRLILDESHEYICYDRKMNIRNTRDYLNLIKSKFTWLCSGTPFKNINDLFYIFKILLRKNDEMIDFFDIPSNKYIYFIYKDILNKIIRQNTNESVKNEVNLPTPIMNVEFIQQTEIERAIYDSALGDKDKMIELCNHIMVSEEHIKILGNKPLSLDEIHQKMTKYYKKKIVKTKSLIQNKQEIIEKLKKKENKSHDDLNQIQIIDTSILECEKNLKMFESKYKIFNLLQSKLNEATFCPICFDSIKNKTKIITDCGHIFCSSCISSSINIHNIQKCPMCRENINRDSIKVMRAESDPNALNQLSEKQKNIQNWGGSKMARLIEYIRELNENDSSNRIIVFSKFHNMLKLISKVLCETNIKHVFLNGSASVVKGRIRRFKLDNMINVVLLSSEQSASGLNLTEANHIVLLDTHNSEKSLCHQVEEQAIGRSVRIGQKTNVHVKRFVMEDTIEHENYNHIFL